MWFARFARDTRIQPGENRVAFIGAGVKPAPTRLNYTSLDIGRGFTRISRIKTVNLVQARSL